MTPINTKNRAGDGIHLSKKPAGFWPVENTNRKLKTVKTGTVLSPVTGRLATLNSSASHMDGSSIQLRGI
jgi:ribosomal protein S6E (S10)